MSQIQPPVHQGTHVLKPHRGTTVLVLGILGIVLCFICGIIAWVMGNTDMREIDAGRMDPTGRGLTQAGKICGMISVILACISLAFAVVWVIVVVFVLAGAAAGGAAGGAPGGP